MRGLNVLLVEGGQGRGGADCRWHAGAFLWVALCLAVLVIIELLSPSESVPVQRLGGGAFTFETPLAPVSRTTIRGAGVTLWSE